MSMIKSPIGAKPDHRATVAAMGLRKLHHSVVMPDNAATAGMIFKVKHLVKAETIED